MAGRSKAKFLESLERGREAANPRAPSAEKPAAEMTSDELDEQMRLAKVEVVEANRALAQAVADERERPPTTLGAVLSDLKRSRRRNRRIR